MQREEQPAFHVTARILVELGFQRVQLWTTARGSQEARNGGKRGSKCRTTVSRLPLVGRKAMPAASPMYAQIMPTQHKPPAYLIFRESSNRSTLRLSASVFEVVARLQPPTTVAPDPCRPAAASTAMAALYRISRSGPRKSVRQCRWARSLGGGGGFGRPLSGAHGSSSDRRMFGGLNGRWMYLF